jgi:hypothetical protein
MNMKLIIATILTLTAAGAACAAPDPATTRQQVLTELARARAAGELDFNDATYPLPAREAPSRVTRAEVKAELLRARAAGEMDYTDATYPLSIPSAPAGLTRASVQAEAARALAAGELDCIDATLSTTRCFQYYGR